MNGRARKPARREGASTSRARIADRCRGWLHHHRLSAADSLRRLLESPGASLSTWLVIGIALALPSALNVALDNSNRLSAGWQSPAQISVFLKGSVSEVQARDLLGRLTRSAGITEARLITREAALLEFSAQSEFADVLASLDENPLPHLILVTPASVGPEVSSLRRALEVHPEVARTVVDMAWLARLNSMLALSQQLVWALAGLLALGVLLILGNTLRLAIASRRDEIVIVKLVGGSNAFVRRPFLYTGLWYGVGGGVVAALLVLLATWLLSAPVQHLAQLYQSNFRLTGLGLMGSLNLIIIGGGLGLVGAGLAVSRHLRTIKPT